MSTDILYRLSGLSLALGGTVAAVAHVVCPMTPTDPSMLGQYASASQPAHLFLFGGAVLVLLGLPGLYLRLGLSGGLLAFAGSLLLYLGILFADVLHCILEFSIIPVLMRSIPYVTISIVQTTYDSTPLAILQTAGQYLVFLGTPLLAIGATRASVFPAWTGAPLFFSSLLMVASLFPWTARFIGPHFVTSLYLSLTLSGTAIVLNPRT